MTKSGHCIIRQTQRAIPNQIISWLYYFGETRQAPGNVQELYFSKHSIKEMKSELGASLVKLCSKFWNVRLIKDMNGKVVTVYWRR
jgi:hypothetical protein